MKHSSLNWTLAIAAVVCLVTPVDSNGEGPIGVRQSQMSKPNIVMILADDLGWGDVGFNGRKSWKTPHLDRLARQGIRFSRWYTNAVVCAPSRAALMTGKYSIHNGVSGNNQDLPRAETTLAEALKSGGYTTALFGKWHHGQTRPGETSYVHPMDQGFDEFVGFTNAGHAWEHLPRELWHGREMRPVSGWSDTIFANHSLEFIQRNRKGPFFLYLSFNAPHFHIEAQDEDVNPFLGRFPERDPEKPSNARYAAMVTRLDKEVGRVVDAIDKAGLGRNTLIVFSSDHGATFEVGNAGASAFHDSNAPFRGQKRTLTEGGIRVPGVARWTGHIRGNQISNTPTMSMDVFPTALEAAGLNVNPGWKVDGASQFGAWTTGKPAPDRTLYWEWRNEGSQVTAAMQGSLKLILERNNPVQLYDVVADPAERINLAPGQAIRVKELRTSLETWMATESEASKGR